MTEQRNDGNDQRLETLYREAGDVEPDAGLDRIIRARADEAVDSRRSSNRLPWLGGLATASVAIVAIAVVLQQAPPAGGPVPESPAASESAEPEAFMAPSMGLQSQRKLSSDALDARAKPSGEQGSSNRMRRAPAEEAMPEPAAEARSRIAPGDPAAAPAPPPAPTDDSMQDRITITDLARSTADLAELRSGDALIERLRELIAAERIDEARRLLEQARARDPGIELPEEIEKVLRGPDSGNP